MRIMLISFIIFCSLNLKGQTQVDFFTNYGDFRVELYDSLMPITTSNFINLVSTNFYDGAIFHRVIKNFMIQGGDVSPPPPSIPDEFDSTLSNIQKTISMANSGPNTGTCQFFINLVDNTYLDFDKPPFTSKHPVFGITVSGFNIVEDIGDVQTNFNDKPYIDVIMDSVRIVTNQTNTDFINIENKPNLVKIVDLLGRNSYPQKNIPLFYIYDNGEVRKVILK
jgi:peptidylprolyl isomerase